MSRFSIQVLLANVEGSHYVCLFQLFVLPILPFIHLVCVSPKFTLWSIPQARIHKRQEKEERQASARAGREDRPLFGARTAMKQRKVITS